MYTSDHYNYVYVSQAVAVVVFDVLLLIVKLSVWVESQPNALVYKLVYVPDVVSHKP